MSSYICDLMSPPLHLHIPINHRLIGHTLACAYCYENTCSSNECSLTQIDIVATKFVPCLFLLSMPTFTPLMTPAAEMRSHDMGFVCTIECTGQVVNRNLLPPSLACTELSAREEKERALLKSSVVDEFGVGRNCMHKHNTTRYLSFANTIPRPRW